MSKDSGFQEKTEQATPKRLLDAKRKGTVARSRELTTTIVMLSGAGMLLVSANSLAESLINTLHAAFNFSRMELGQPNFILTQLAGSVSEALVGLLPLFATVAGAAILGSVALGGWSFSPSALAFKGERINVLKGIKRIFSVKGLVELAKAMAKFGLIAIVATAWLWYLFGEIRGLSYAPSQSAILHAGRLCLLSLLFLSLTLILIAAIDVPFQLWQHAKNMRMTRQEVRDEQKETDGRPEVKARIRALQQQTANARMMEALPEADVVITNPTHYAVAIKYQSDAMAAPTVIAKGRGEIAATIRERARENDIPLFSAPPLARALYRTVRIGQEIPYELYKAVAQVLAYVFQLSDYLAGRGPLPDKPHPEVDESLSAAAASDAQGGEA